jgi:adenylate cyclase
MVYENIKNKLAFGYEYIEEQTVKNIKDPVRVYRILMEPGTKVPEAISSKILEETKPEKKKFSRAVLAVIALAIIAVAAVLYQFVLRPSVPKVETEVASKEKMAFPLPDKPSIAVLPFVNMSGDPKQEFFSDGITEDIITALSKIPKLFVIARNSTFTYKGKPVKVKQVSEELGVRYVLEGSVQKSGDRVRITAQLIDALSGHHLWSERYDREMKDLFALQDEVTLKILMAMQVKLTEGEQASLGERHFKGKQGLERYSKIYEALYYLRKVSIEGNNTARRMGEEIIAKWPENPWGYLLLGWAYRMDLVLGSAKSPRESIEKAMELAQKALALDDSLSGAHSLLGFIYSHRGEHEKAIAEGERAVALDPNGVDSNEIYAGILFFANRWKEAISAYLKAIRLNPSGSSSIAFNSLGVAYSITGRYKEAVSAWKQAILRNPDNLFAHINLASVYSAMGREKEARAEAAEVLRINPKFSLDYWAKVISFVKDQSVIDKAIASLRKAGLK